MAMHLIGRCRLRYSDHDSQVKAKIFFIVHFETFKFIDFL